MAEEESTQGRSQTRRKLPRRSPVWEHFILFTDAQGKEKARCKRCSKVLDAGQGTSSPNKHVKKCSAQEAAAVGVEAARPPPPPPCAPSDVPGLRQADHEPGLEEEASRDLARMIALHGYDPSVVEDDYFRSFVRRLNPEFEMPSRRAIEEMCDAIFGDHRRDLCGYPFAGMSVAVGTAKTIEAGQVLYTACQFIDVEWNLKKWVEDVYVVLPVGDYYHAPVCGINVVSLADAVSKVASDLSDVEHALFMVAGEITGDIGHIKLKDHIKQKHYNEPISTTHVDHVLHSIARCLLPDQDFAKRIFRDIEAQPGLYMGRVKRLSQLGQYDPWEYDEHWYSCYRSLEIIVGQKIPETDWESRKLLRYLWGEIYRAIKIVSDSSRSTSNLCLEELFRVRHVLQSQLSEASAAHAGKYSGFGNKNVANVLREALDTVDKAIQDSYLIWSIPLVLDPRYKLRRIKSIFERSLGSEVGNNYISEVRRKVKELYTTLYMEMAVDSSSPLLEQAGDGQCRSQDDSHADAETELDRYLQDSPAPGTKGFDILNWWKVHGSVQYPMVAQMARDALAMPTCSKLSSDQIAHVRSIIRGYHVW